MDDCFSSTWTQRLCEYMAVALSLESGSYQISGANWDEWTNRKAQADMTNIVVIYYIGTKDIQNQQNPHLTFSVIVHMHVPLSSQA